MTDVKKAASTNGLGFNVVKQPEKACIHYTQRGTGNNCQNFDNVANKELSPKKKRPIRLGSPLEIRGGLKTPDRFQSGDFMTTRPNNKREILDNQPLTGKPTKATLQNVPGHITRHDSKQTNGGNVTNYQPPHMRGFFVFMPATSGDCTLLPGVARDKIPAYGKTCSVSIWTLRGTRQLYCCCNSKQSNEERAMQNATAHATTTPVVNGDKGLSPIPTNNTRCLFPTDTLLNAIIQAKAKHQRDERGAAYQQLLKQFHQAILPAFLIEAGSISKASNLLGLHRETLAKYVDHAGIDLNKQAGGVL